MNGIEKISARILADAESEAAAIRAQAEEKAALIRADYDRRIESEQLSRACDIAQETGNTEAHILRVAERSQHDCGSADDQSAEHDEPMALKEAFFFHSILSFDYLTHLAMRSSFLSITEKWKFVNTK